MAETIAIVLANSLMIITVCHSCERVTNAHEKITSQLVCRHSECQLQMAHQKIVFKGFGAVSFGYKLLISVRRIWISYAKITKVINF